MKRFLPHALGLLIVAYAATGLYQVEAGELAVVRRFGRVHHLASPGLNLGLPWPWDKVDRVRVQQRQLIVGYQETDIPVTDVAPPGQLLTGDNNLLNVRATVSYTVDSEHVVDYVLNQDRAEALLARATESALAGLFAEQRINDVLYGRSRSGNGTASSVEAELQQRITALLAPYRLGVSLAAVNLTPPKPPAEVAEEFAQASREEANSARRIAQARIQAAELISRERQAASATLSTARSNKAERLSKARARSDALIRLHQSLQATPDPTQARATYYLQQMREILARVQARLIGDAEGDYYWVVPAP